LSKLPATFQEFDMRLICIAFWGVLTTFVPQVTSAENRFASLHSGFANDPGQQSLAISDDESVDMLLCLAADVSESVTRDEYKLQREGHAAAIRDPKVIDVIQGGLHGKIAVLYFEWAKQDQQFVGADWHIIGDEASANTFANNIDKSPMPPWIEASVRNTSTGEAVRYCLKQFQTAPMKAPRRVIDISSDGTSNIGAKIEVARDEALSQGVVINALVILGSKSPFSNPTHEQPAGGLQNYFEKNVVGGAGSFVQVANGYESFSEMIRRKFLLELSALH